MIGIVGAFIAGAGAVLFAIALLWRSAPIGYEDDAGFHYGEDPRTQDQLLELEALRLGLSREEIEHIKRRREWAEFG